MANQSYLTGKGDDLKSKIKKDLFDNEKKLSHVSRKKGENKMYKYVKSKTWY